MVSGEASDASSAGFPMSLVPAFQQQRRSVWGRGYYLTVQIHQEEDFGLMLCIYVANLSAVKSVYEYVRQYRSFPPNLGSVPVQLNGWRSRRALLCTCLDSDSPGAALKQHLGLGWCQPTVPIFLPSFIFKVQSNVLSNLLLSYGFRTWLQK